ncbi:hypothetical protein DFP72DRAFT_851017 [Ephemerocybe angulata]|uniref:Uncharacterized protein n=1 Tax=Ephemerocybe angulata TaxID=980116 RepID=A0A8H6M3P3_9AGAR|nr:hypothetical protein DFP72DRAFT_851017 [Tulosesus angulatus]
MFLTYNHNPTTLCICQGETPLEPIPHYTRITSSRRSPQHELIGKFLYGGTTPDTGSHIRKRSSTGYGHQVNNLKRRNGCEQSNPRSVQPLSHAGEIDAQKKTGGIPPHSEMAEIVKTSLWEPDLVRPSKLFSIMEKASTARTAQGRLQALITLLALQHPEQTRSADERRALRLAAALSWASSHPAPRLPAASHLTTCKYSGALHDHPPAPFASRVHWYESNTTIQERILTDTIPLGPWHGDTSGWHALSQPASLHAGTNGDRGPGPAGHSRTYDSP